MLLLLFIGAALAARVDIDARAEPVLHAEAAVLTLQPGRASRLPLPPSQKDIPLCFNTPTSTTPSTSTSPLRFTDVTSSAGVRGEHPQSSVRTSPNCLFDSFDTSRRVWDAGTFCMPEILTGGAGTGDFDGDGYPDLYVTRLDAADSLYRNNGGDGTFTDVTVESGLQITSDIRSNGVALLDIDNDGDLDIFLSTLGDTRFYLFVNDGTGHFSEEAVARGAALARPAGRPAGEGGAGGTSSFSVAVGDYDNDGFLDLYTTEWFPRLHVPEALIENDAGVHALTTCKLLRNRGAEGFPGHFVDASWEAGIRPRVGGASREDEQMSLEKWRSAPVQTAMRRRLLALNLTLADADARLAAVNAEAEALFEKGGAAALDGKHFPVHYMEGFPYVGTFQFGARFVDLDGDGWPELLISGDFGTTQLYWNNRNGTFTTGPLHLLWDLFDNSMGATVGDVNGDGRLDVLFTSMALKAPTRLAVDRFFPKAGIASNFEGNHLYANEGARLFADVTQAAGVKDTGWAWGGVLFDYDNDGWLDLVVSNGMDDPETTDDDFAVNTPNAAFRNTGVRRPAAAGKTTATTTATTTASSSSAAPPTFTPVAASLGLDDRRDGRGYFELDFDKDGDLDLFLVNHADFPVLYRNDGGDANPWLRVRALESGCGEGVPASLSESETETESSCAALPPRESVGARVWMRRGAGEDGSEQVREIGSSAAFMAQSELTAHFGLGALPTTGGAAGGEAAVGAGAEAPVHRVRVHWPARNVSRVLYGVPVRTEVVVRAPRGRDVEVVTHVGGVGGGGGDGEEAVALVPSCAAVTPLISAAEEVPGPDGALLAEVRVHPSGRWVEVRPSPSAPVNATTTVRFTIGTGAGAGATETVQDVIIRVAPEPPAKKKRSAPVKKASSAAPVTAMEALAAHWRVEHSVPRREGGGGGTTGEGVGGKFQSGQTFHPSPDGEKHRVIRRTRGLAGGAAGTTGAMPDDADGDDAGGAAGSPFLRLLPPIYEEPSGATMPGTKRFKGAMARLPSARELSTRVMSASALGLERAPLSSRIASPASSAASSASASARRPALSDVFTWFAAFVAHDVFDTFPHWSQIRKASGGRESDVNIPAPKGDSVWDPEGKGGKSHPFWRGPHTFAAAARPLLLSRLQSAGAGADGGNSSSSSPASRTARRLVNSVSSVLDLHTVYGGDAVRAGKLLYATSPPGSGQLILSRPPQAPQGSGGGVGGSGAPKTPSESLSQALLPLDDSSDPANAANPYAADPGALFLSGDDRVNLHPGLIAFHTLFAREHNRLYGALGMRPEFGGRGSAPAPTTTGKGVQGMIGDGNMTLYAAVATIVRAQYQAAVWNDFLPVLLGRAEVAKFPRYRGYNASVDPSPTSEFAAAAFPAVWHSALSAAVPRLDEAGKSLKKGPIRLVDAWFSPTRVAFEGGLDPLFRGAWSTPSEAVDVVYTDDARNGFLGAKARGLDLAALDIQRGRDHGLPPYNTVRRALGLSPVTSFSDLVPASSGLPPAAREKLAVRLRELYAPPNGSVAAAAAEASPEEAERAALERVELLVGGLLEGPGSRSGGGGGGGGSGDGAVGPTFAAIIREQFTRLRDGDPMWFENVPGGFPGSPRSTGGGPPTPTLAFPLSAVIGRYVSLDDLKETTVASLVSRNTGVRVGPEELDGVAGNWADEEDGEDEGWVGMTEGGAHRSLLYVRKRGG
jgi:hypothetical protein